MDLCCKQNEFNWDRERIESIKGSIKDDKMDYITKERRLK